MLNVFFGKTGKLAVKENCRISRRPQHFENFLIGRVFHDHIHGAANGVPFHFRRQGLMNLYASQEIGGYDVKRYIPGLVIRTGNLDSIDQGIVVPRIQASDNWIRFIATTIALDGEAADPLQHIGGIDIRRSFHGARRNDIHQVIAVLFFLAGAGFFFLADPAKNLHISQHRSRFRQRHFELHFLVRPYGHRLLEGPEADILYVNQVNAFG